MILLIGQGLSMLKVELVYATIEAQEILQLTVKEGADIATCIEVSGITSKHPEIDLTTMKVGIFSQVKPLSHVVNEGDRIEIYRPLIADPKAVRRRKAELAGKN